jgi:large subunit ribosomal protein L9
MRVILLNEVEHTGRRGEEVDVKTGFARNYLIPQGMAVEASDGNRKWFQSQRKRIEAESARDREEAAEIAAAIAGTRVEKIMKVGENDHLYGSVTSSDIAELLAAKGIVVNRRKIALDGGIKTLGDHRINIVLHPEVTAELTVTVLPEE